MISTLSRYFYNINKTNPVKGFGVILDYNYALVMLPAAVVGSAIGVIPYNILPDILIVSIMIVFLTLLLAGTIVKFRKEFMRE